MVVVPLIGHFLINPLHYKCGLPLVAPPVKEEAIKMAAV